MIKLKRNEEIKNKYAKGTNMLKLAKEYSLSVPRISRIVNREKKYCKKHKNIYYSKCFFCTKNKSFESFLDSNRFEKMKKELQKCSEKNRERGISKDRKKIIKLLRNKYKMSFAKIGKLLGRHHSTITYNYYSKK